MRGASKNRPEGELKAKYYSTLAIGLAVAATLFCPATGRAQGPFPEGEARDTVIVVCSQCHVLTRITDNDLDAEEWEFMLYDMIARGAPLHERDIESVRRYLVEHFATDER